jgi:hypothetical protein
VLQPRLDFGAGIGPAFIAVADLNRDHRPDFVVTHTNTNTVTVLFGRCLRH